MRCDGINKFLLLTIFVLILIAFWIAPLNIKEKVDFLKSILEIIFMILGGIIGTFIYFNLAPTLSLTITPIWVGDLKNFLILRFEISNKSRVRITDCTIKIQTLEHTMPKHGVLSQWVPFTQKSIKQMEEPIEWHEPEIITETTKRVFPGESIIIERLYQYSNSPLILHVGLQAQIKLGLLYRFVTRKKENWSQTTTCFVVKDFKK
jgi:hypothetical protein